MWINYKIINKLFSIFPERNGYLHDKIKKQIKNLFKYSDYKHISKINGGIVVAETSTKNIINCYENGLISYNEIITHCRNNPAKAASKLLFYDYTIKIKLIIRKLHCYFPDDLSDIILAFYGY